MLDSRYIFIIELTCKGIAYEGGSGKRGVVDDDIVGEVVVLFTEIRKPKGVVNLV